MKKKAIILSIVVLVTLIAYFYNKHYKTPIPNDLRQALEWDLVTHFSIGTSPVLNPSWIDEIIGYQGFRYSLQSIQSVDAEEVAPLEKVLCLKIKVIYRIPEKSSVYSPGSPTEYFLYLAWETDNEWQVQKVAQSGVNKKLDVSSCSLDP